MFSDRFPLKAFDVKLLEKCYLCTITEYINERPPKLSSRTL